MVFKIEGETKQSTQTKKNKNGYTIFNEYVELYDKHKNIYGENTIVLMMVGMFYEMYSLNDDINGPNLNKISSMLNILCSRKNKSVSEISFANPFMVGFPNHTLDKYLDIFVKKYNYTVVVVDQFDNEMGKKAKKERKVVDIISPSTYITDMSDYKCNYLMSLYFYKIKDRKENIEKIFFAISLFELSIGKVLLYEDYNKDEKLLFDNIYRIIIKYNPKEIIIFGDDIDYNIIKKYINTDNYCIHNKINSYNKKILDITYQHDLLKKVYKNTGMLNPIEYIDLERNNELLVSFINLIEFAYLHNENIIEKIDKPKFVESNDELVLGYNLIKKLDIVSDDLNKYSSLLNILNNSKTHIGKRNFEKCLLNPLTNIDDINSRYQNIELMLEGKKDLGKYVYEILREKLKGFCDLERFFRKIFLLKLHPQEFSQIYESILKYIEIYENLESYKKFNKNFNKFLDNNFLEQVKFLIKFLEEKLNFSEIEKYNYDNISGHIFNKGIYKDLDELQTQLDDNIRYFEDVAEGFNDLSNNYANFFKVEYNDKLGYHLQITVNRFNIFKRDYDKVKLNDITTKKPSSSSSIYRIFLPDFNKKNEEIILLKNKVKEKCTELYKKFCKNLYEEYQNILNKIISNLEIIDYSTTNAYNSVLYKYSKPIISQTNSNSHLDMKEVRHPIIEIINEDIKYIPNDIKLGMSDNGILLYGMNSSGKSSLMKSIGLNMIMAQAGMYVACKSLKYYPYCKIYSRIPGGDNLFKGQSTFVGEISEIRNILKSADSRTLVIGDELCSGTETNSAISIVSAGIINLIEKKSSFIFATHLHELATLKRITELENLKIKHLSVKYIEDTNTLVFDRKLKDGAGESVYGLEVCRSLDLDDDFMKLATLIRKEIMGTDILLRDKKSKYNSKVIMDKCKICNVKNATETHHIKFQRDADENGFIEHFHKNKKFNLICLCEDCHNKIHNGDLEIFEAILTSNGISYSK